MSMSMGGRGGGGGMGSWRRDTSVVDHRLAPGTTRRILAYARPYRFLIAWFLAFVVVGALLVVATPLLLQRIIDDGVGNGDKPLVVFLASMIAVVAVGEAAINLLQRWFSSRIGEGLIFDLRTDVFTHVQRQSIAFFTRSQTGSLVTRLNSDVIGAQQAFTSTLSGVVSNIISVVVVLATMFTLSWQITLLALAIVPLLLLPARRVGRRLAGLARRGMELNAELGNRMTERFNVAGALLVKIFGDPQRESAEFADRAGKVRDIGVRTAMSSRVFFASMGAMASLATAMVYGVGGVLTIEGAVTIGVLVAFAGLLGRLYGPVTALTNVQVDVMTALVSFERVFEVLDLEPMVVDPSDPAALPAGPLSVEYDDVRFRYPAASAVTIASLDSARVVDGPDDEEVLHGISLRVEPGQVLALVGPSGSGKTTLASLAVRLYEPTGGTIRIGGVDLRDARETAVHGAVGMVTQDAHMFHDTVRANLDYAAPLGAQISDEAIWAALTAAHVADVVRRLPQGLDTVVGDRGHRLSGGEKQRVAIARLLLRAPRVVVLDEATAHLDSESEAAVQRALDEAMSGRTSIVIAHRLSTVRRADVIAVISGGTVREQGTHADLLARGGLYAELYRTQFAVDPASATTP